MADNVAITAGSGTTIGADEVVDGSLGTVKVQYVKLMDGTLDGTSKAAVSSAGLKVDLGADNDVTISGTVTVDGSGSTQPISAVSLPLPTGASTAAKQPALGTAGTASSDVITVQGITSMTPLQVGDNSGSLTVDNNGTFAVQATAVGTVADDATTPGAPVMIGGMAKETDGTDPGSVSAEDDVARVITDRNRRMMVNTVHPNLFDANDNQSSAQTNTVLKAAPGAGLSLYITDIIISNGATAGTVKLVEDTAGTPVTKVPTMYLAANGGLCKRFQTPIRVTANKNIGYTSTTVTTHSIMIAGYIAP